MAHQLDELQQKQLRQAEELLFSDPQEVGFARELFFGRFRREAIFPYPTPSDSERQAGDAAVAEVRRFVTEHIDPAVIDREADIPVETICGLGEVGVLGATIAPEYGGRGLTQHNYCRVMEVIGGHCALKNPKTLNIRRASEHMFALQRSPRRSCGAQRLAWDWFADCCLTPVTLYLLFITA